MGEAGVYSAPVVFNLALISGVSSSLGSVRGSAEAIARIFNNPEEYIESFRNIVELLENLGMLDQVVDQMVGSFQQRMETNNPFSETGKVTKEILYQTFRGGWYAGYVIGEVMKLALTVGALKAAKGAAIYTKVATVVKSTTAGRLALLVTGKIDAAQFRVASTLAVGSVTIGKSALRGAKTVGSAVRVYQLSRSLDFDARELSAVQQANLRRHLIWNDKQGVDDLNRMGRTDREETLSMGSSCRVFSSGVGTFRTDDCGLSDEERSEVYHDIGQYTSSRETFEETFENLDDGTQQAIYDALADADAETSRYVVEMVEETSASRLRSLRQKGVDLQRHAEALEHVEDPTVRIETTPERELGGVKDVIFRLEYFTNHMAHQNDHHLKKEIVRVLKDPDAVYRSKGDQDVYVYKKTMNGVTHFVRTEDFGRNKNTPFGGIRVRSAYYSPNPDDKLSFLYNKYNLYEVM